MQNKSQKEEAIKFLATLSCLDKLEKKVYDAGSLISTELGNENISEPDIDRHIKLAAERITKYFREKKAIPAYNMQEINKKLTTRDIVDILDTHFGARITKMDEDYLRYDCPFCNASDNFVFSTHKKVGYCHNCHIGGDMIALTCKKLSTTQNCAFIWLKTIMLANEIRSHFDA